MKVSIFDLVVGDIVQLNIGDQVIFEVFSASKSTLLSLLASKLPCKVMQLCLLHDWHHAIRKSVAAGCKH